MTDLGLQIDGLVVVTGSARGIGAGIAQTLCEHGAEVVIADLNLDLATETADRLRDAGHRAYPVHLDVSLEASVEALADKAMEFGRLGGWVNNAGISQRVPLVDLTVDEWDRMMSVNARGVFLGTRAAARRMEEGGAIVNVASISAYAALPHLTHYGASKGAVVAFTKHAAIDLAPRGIRVNAVAPGTIESAMTQGRLSDPKQLEWTQQRIPLGRVGQPKDVGNAIAFLCSRAASYITGTILSCDGGWLATA